MKRDWDSIMFDGIGIKIQKVAKVIVWFNIISCMIGGFVLFLYALDDFEDFGYFIFLAPIAVVVGCVIAWLSAITLYGFGKLIEDVEAIRYKNPPVIKLEAEPNKQPLTKTNDGVVEKKKQLPQKNSEMISYNTNTPQQTEVLRKDASSNPLSCPECGEDLEFMGWNDNELKEMQTCPLCGKQILLKQ